MKATILLLTLSATIAFVNSQIDPQWLMKMTQIVQKCTKKHSTTTGDLIKMLWEQNLPKTQPMKCTIDCYLTENGYIKEGKLDWEAMRAEGQHIKYNGPERAKAEEVMNICEAKAITATEECELGSALLKCTFEEAKKQGLKPADLMKVMHKSG